MVLQKRLNVGFNGYQIPAMPRGSRSARGRRRWCRKTAEEKQMYAFELLATVARNILLGQENIPGSTSKSPPAKQNELQLFHKKKPFKVEPSDQGSCDEGTLTRKGSPGVSSSGGSHPSAVVVKSDVSGRAGFAEGSKVQNSVEFRAKKVEFPISRSPAQVKKEKGGDGSIEAVSNAFGIENSLDFDVKHPPLVSSDSSVEVHQYKNHRSSPKFNGEVEIMNAVFDDEENSSGCTHPSPIASKHFRSQKIGDRRIKKIKASKFWKVGPTLLKDGEFYSNDAGPKPLFRNRKMCCTRRRTQRSSFKRRQLFMRSSVPAGLGGRSEDLYKPFENASQGGARGLGAADLHGANETWPSLASPKLSSKPEDYKVKLRIKSFKVPELFIEMPETATVGSLKRTVLETVSAMLVNGLRVGVISQGKKVRDDSKTLLQAGIAHGEKQPDSLGFTLEVNPAKASQHFSGPGDPYLLESPETPKPLGRVPGITTSVSSAIGSNPDGCTVEPPPDHHRDRHWPRPLAVVEPSPPPQGGHPAPTSKALVPVPVPSLGGDQSQSLAVVPSSHRKTKRSEVVQRRIRRPFSVAEVEALVQAVECLGTGRWRDVKIRAFENVKHRTYVDLKDKWKTLVHTARISPQQRRGEPVPQELLDRVLQAHAHWSHQQAKLQGKLTPPPQLLLPPADQSILHHR